MAISCKIEVLQRSSSVRSSMIRGHTIARFCKIPFKYIVSWVPF